MLWHSVATSICMIMILFCLGAQTKAKCLRLRQVHATQFLFVCVNENDVLFTYIHVDCMKLICKLLLYYIYVYVHAYLYLISILF